jgi:hypothetical protein
MIRPNEKGDLKPPLTPARDELPDFSCHCCVCAAPASASVEKKSPARAGARRRGSSPPDRTVDATIKARRNRLGPSWTVLLVTQ